jgi:hypothetical protein
VPVPAHRVQLQKDTILCQLQCLHHPR